MNKQNITETKTKFKPRTEMQQYWDYCSEGGKFTFEQWKSYQLEFGYHPEPKVEIKICLLCKKEADTTIEVVKNRYEIDVCKDDMDFINRNLDTIEKLYTAVSPKDERSIVL